MNFYSSSMLIEASFISLIFRVLLRREKKLAEALERDSSSSRGVETGKEPLGCARIIRD